MPSAAEHSGPGTNDQQPPCAICHRPLRPGAFYVVRVDVFADPTPEPIDTTAPPGAPGHVPTVEEVLAEMETMTTDELQDQVARRFEYVLCSGCQTLILKNPLGLPRRKRPGMN